jgi:hypothetical protein
MLERSAQFGIQRHGHDGLFGSLQWMVGILGLKEKIWLQPLQSR